MHWVRGTGYEYDMPAFGSLSTPNLDMIEACLFFGESESSFLATFPGEAPMVCLLIPRNRVLYNQCSCNQMLKVLSLLVWFTSSHMHQVLHLMAFALLSVSTELQSCSAFLRRRRFVLFRNAVPDI